MVRFVFSDRLKGTMAKKKYSSDLCRQLELAANDPSLEIRHRPTRYENGTVLPIEITGVFPAIEGKAELTVDKFLGGGFAGQVYRCKLTGLELPEPIPGLEEGKLYAVKIVIPPSAFSRWFRNTTYWLAFQGPFSSQVNHGACRAGLLWQKLVRRASLVKFGRETAVKDAYASFWDANLNAYGEITEWIEGRMWHLEADDNITKRFDWKNINLADTGSPEFVDKRRFMRGMVELMHEMGAPEFARQYEWSTMKSQPNCMKRTDTEDGGLCAIDFRAGLALLPWLPMSPGDFKLILNGLKRGALVQFDRCDLSKMEAYVASHPEVFEDVQPMIDELKIQDRAYRRSLLDIYPPWPAPDLRPWVAEGCNCRTGGRLSGRRLDRRSLCRKTAQGWLALRTLPPAGRGSRTWKNDPPTMGQQGLPQACLRHPDQASLFQARTQGPCRT